MASSHDHKYLGHSAENTFVRLLTNEKLLLIFLANRYDGLTTFHGFMIHTFTIDAFIAGCVLFTVYVCRVYNQGHPPFKSSESIFCPIVRTERMDDECCMYCNCHNCCYRDGCCYHRGNFVFGCAMFCFAVSALVSLILISYFVGPFFAFSALPQCYRYVCNRKRRP
jgi:hypothetical protein